MARLLKATMFDDLHFSSWTDNDFTAHEELLLLLQQLTPEYIDHVNNDTDYPPISEEDRQYVDIAYPLSVHLNNSYGGIPQNYCGLFDTGKILFITFDDGIGVKLNLRITGLPQQRLLNLVDTTFQSTLCETSYSVLKARTAQDTIGSELINFESKNKDEWLDSYWATKDNKTFMLAHVDEDTQKIVCQDQLTRSLKVLFEPFWIRFKDTMQKELVAIEKYIPNPAPIFFWKGNRASYNVFIKALSGDPTLSIPPLVSNSAVAKYFFRYPKDTAPNNTNRYQKIILCKGQQGAFVNFLKQLLSLSEGLKPLSEQKNKMPICLACNNPQKSMSILALICVNHNNTTFAYDNFRKTTFGTNKSREVEISNHLNEIFIEFNK